MGPLQKPLPFAARIFDGLNHQVNVRSTKDGSPLKSLKPQRPAGMSGRQWDKLKREQRKQRRAAQAAHQSHEKQVAGFFQMGGAKQG